VTYGCFDISQLCPNSFTTVKQSLQVSEGSRSSEGSLQRSEGSDIDMNPRGIYVSIYIYMYIYIFTYIYISSLYE
jgi:hypothetical protein